MIKTLIDPERVVDLAYSNAEFTPASIVSLPDIVAAEQKYLVPVIGEALYEALQVGEYPLLLSDYIAPALALYVREVINAPSAPRSKEGLQRARSMMLRLSNHLDNNQIDYPEYNPSCNILKRCRIDGTHIQIH